MRKTKEKQLTHLSILDSTILAICRENTIYSNTYDENIKKVFKKVEPSKWISIIDNVKEKVAYQTYKEKQARYTHSIITINDEDMLYFISHPQNKSMIRGFVKDTIKQKITI